MKQKLNDLAFWLYKRTLAEKPVDMGALWRGKKVMVSKYIPEDTIIVGEGRRNEIAKAILNHDIKV